MSKRSKSVKTKMDVINAYQKQTRSTSGICFQYDVNESTIKDWLYKYKKYGVEGLKESQNWKSYSKELKLDAIHDYLTNQYTFRDIVKKHDISSTSVFGRWLKKYNSHSEIRPTSEGIKLTMTKGRKTDWRERIDIAFPLEMIIKKLLNYIDCLINKSIKGSRNMKRKGPMDSKIDA